MDPDEALNCAAHQLGFYWLLRHSVAAVRREPWDVPFQLSEFARPEIRPLAKWACSYNGFIPYEGGRNIEDLDIGTGRMVSFTIREGKGKIVYLPLKPGPRKHQVKEQLIALAGSVLSLLRL